MIAVVMAGGEGSRLRPLTLGRPKPMVPMLNIPVMEHILTLLKRHGITEIVVTVHYLASVIEDYFGDGSEFGVDIHYALEETPLGTAGSVKNAEQWLKEPFLIISGDAITDIDLTAAIEFHKEKQSTATLVLYRVASPLEYGVVITDNQGAIQRFLEKPSWGEVFSDTVNTGIYILEPSVLDLIPAGKSSDFGGDVFPQLLANSEPMFGYIAGGYWCDVGSLPDYLKATQDMLSGAVNLPLPYQRHTSGIISARSAVIEPGVVTFGPVFVGEGAVVRRGATLHGPLVIGDSTVVESGATIDRSVIWSNCLISNAAHVSGAIIGKQCSIKAGAIIAQGVVIGDGCTVGEKAVVQSDVKIWPNKEVEQQATVSSSLIWGGRAKRSLFAGHASVSGLTNVELTPELAAKVGAAYGTTLPVGGCVLVNRDHSKAARMIKRAIVSGLPSSGVDVLDTSTVPLPVVRFETRMSRASGGIHVRVSPTDHRVVDIKLFDAHGADVNKNAERKIANVYVREDVRRVPSERIGSIVAGSVPEQTALNRYIAAFEQRMDRSLFERKAPPIVVDYNGGLITPVGQRVLRSLGLPLIELNAVPTEPVSRSLELVSSSLRILGSVTKAVGASAGFLFNYSGTRLTIVDEQGIALPPWHALALMVQLARQQATRAIIGVPLTAPRLMSTVAAAAQNDLRTLAPDPVIMSRATTETDLSLVGDGAGGFAFPELASGFDALFTTVRLLESLQRANTPLSRLASEIPPFHMATTEAYCPWERKGKVMRRLHEQAEETGGTSAQGVRLTQDRQVVVIVPDAEKPVFHVQAEAESDQHALALAERYAEIIRTFQEA